jgi:hypothetical protein
MSLQFARVGYDAHDIKAEEVQNNKIANYMHERFAHEVQNTCYSPFGSGPAQSMLSRPMMEGYVDLANKADVESKLRNIHLPLNHPQRNQNKDYLSISRMEGSSCGVESMTNEDTRFTHPIQNYRELSTTQLVFTPYLHMNPQNVVAETNDFHTSKERIGRSTRTMSKQYTNNYMKNRSKYNLNKDWAEKYNTLLPKYIKQTNQ